MYNWQVVPLCDNQLKDVTPSDILENGLYRRCNTYKSGGGYDMLPSILTKRNMFISSEQFVVQLKGCPFKCPYCYVTPQGINGDAVSVSTDSLVESFRHSKLDIFHLMGGAPALYISHWGELIKALENKGCKVFHSDLLLAEFDYTEQVLNSINSSIAIHAVSIKGWDEESFTINTGTKPDTERMKRNLKMLHKCNINCYITFTGMSDEQAEKANSWLDIPQELLEDSFCIEIKEYDALK